MSSAYELIKDSLAAQANPVQAEAMMAYMRDQYLMYGIKAPERREIVREVNLLSIFPVTGDRAVVKQDLIDFVEDCWEDEYRDLQYVAMDIMAKRLRWLTPVDIPWLVSLVMRKSWWDTVDWLASTAIGSVLKDDRLLARSLAYEWIDHKYLWLQRVALIFQLKYKDETDGDLLLDMVKRVADSDEFFLRKASGWALRQYSRYEPEVVRQFIATYDLSALARREASRYI